MLNPLSKIPTLMLDDGQALFDSLVNCEYLNAQADGPLFSCAGASRWSALRWHALGDGLLDALILWRNERERDQPLPALWEAFELKTCAALQVLESEVAALERAPFGIGHVAVACALGYIDYRFGSLGWRDERPQLAQWHAHMRQRPSFAATEPVEG